MSKIQKQQFDEWFDSEVTRHFLGLLHARLDQTFGLRAEVFFPGEPQKTQEGKAHLLGMEAAFGELIEAFEEKDLSVLEEEEQADVEQIGNSPERRPSSH